MDIDNLETFVLLSLQEEFKIQFYSTDSIYHKCLSILFDDQLQKYLNSRDNCESLNTFPLVVDMLKNSFFWLGDVIYLSA